MCIYAYIYINFLWSQSNKLEFLCLFLSYRRKGSCMFDLIVLDHSWFLFFVLVSESQGRWRVSLCCQEVVVIYCLIRVVLDFEGLKWGVKFKLKAMSWPLTFLLFLLILLVNFLSAMRGSHYGLVVCLHKLLLDYCRNTQPRFQFIVMNRRNTGQFSFTPVMTVSWNNISFLMRLSVLVAHNVRKEELWSMESCRYNGLL